MLLRPPQMNQQNQNLSNIHSERESEAKQSSRSKNKVKAKQTSLGMRKPAFNKQSEQKERRQPDNVSVHSHGSTRSKKSKKKQNSIGSVKYNVNLNRSPIRQHQIQNNQQQSIEVINYLQNNSPSPQYKFSPVQYSQVKNDYNQKSNVYDKNVNVYKAQNFQSNQNSFKNAIKNNPFQQLNDKQSRDFDEDIPVVKLVQNKEKNTTKSNQPSMNTLISPKVAQKKQTKKLGQLFEESRRNNQNQSQLGVSVVPSQINNNSSVLGGQSRRSRSKLGQLFKQKSRQKDINNSSRINENSKITQNSQVQIHSLGNRSRQKQTVGRNNIPQKILDESVHQFEAGQDINKSDLNLSMSRNSPFNSNLGQNNVNSSINNKDSVCFNLQPDKKKKGLGIASKLARDNDDLIQISGNLQSKDIQKLSYNDQFINVSGNLVSRQLQAHQKLKANIKQNQKYLVDSGAYKNNNIPDDNSRIMQQEIRKKQQMMKQKQRMLENQKKKIEEQNNRQKIRIQQQKELQRRKEEQLLQRQAELKRMQQTRKTQQRIWEQQRRVQQKKRIQQQRKIQLQQQRIKSEREKNIQKQRQLQLKKQKEKQIQREKAMQIQKQKQQQKRRQQQQRHLRKKQEIQERQRQLAQKQRIIKQQNQNLTLQKKKLRKSFSNQSQQVQTNKRREQQKSIIYDLEQDSREDAKQQKINSFEKMPSTYSRDHSSKGSQRSNSARKTGLKKQTSLAIKGKKNRLYGEMSPRAQQSFYEQGDHAERTQQQEVEKINKKEQGPRKLMSFNDDEDFTYEVRPQNKTDSYFYDRSIKAPSSKPPISRKSSSKSKVKQNSIKKVPKDNQIKIKTSEGTTNQKKLSLVQLAMKKNYEGSGSEYQSQDSFRSRENSQQSFGSKNSGRNSTNSKGSRKKQSVINLKQKTFTGSNRPPSYRKNSPEKDAMARTMQHQKQMMRQTSSRQRLERTQKQEKQKTTIIRGCSFIDQRGRLVEKGNMIIKGNHITGNSDVQFNERKLFERMMHNRQRRRSRSRQRSLDRSKASSRSIQKRESRNSKTSNENAKFAQSQAYSESEGYRDRYQSSGSNYYPNHERSTYNNYNHNNFNQNAYGSRANFQGSNYRQTPQTLQEFIKPIQHQNIRKYQNNFTYQPQYAYNQQQNRQAERNDNSQRKKTMQRTQKASKKY